MVSSGLGTKFPETRGPACLCNGMKAPDHERMLQLDGTEKPGIQKTLDCYGNLWNLRSRPRQCGDLDDKCFYWIAFFHFPHVNGGVAAFLSVHVARRCPGRQGRPAEVGVLYQFRVSRRGHQPGCAWLAASAQSLPHPGKRVLHRNWICL